MTHLRRVLALAGAAALAVAVVPAAASAEDRPTPQGSKANLTAPAATDGPSLAIAKGERNWLAPDRESLVSLFFAGHVWTGDDADQLNTAKFEIHTLDCSGEDSGVASSMLSYDDVGFLNGGPLIFVFCADGEATYDPGFLEFPGVFTPIEQPVAAGDRVVMTSVRDAGAGTATYTMENTTQGWTESFDGSFGTFVNGSVETGDAAILLDGIEVPPPVFGRDSVKRVQFDGTDLSESGSQKVQMIEEDGTIIERATKWRSALPDERFSLINKT